MHEQYAYTRRFCTDKLLRALRFEEPLDIDAIRDEAIGIAGDAGDEIDEVFEREMGEPDDIELLKKIVAELKELEIAEDLEQVQPTSEELADLAAAGAKLWILDSNRLEAGTELELNFQSRAPYEDDPVTLDPLFSYVDSHAMSRPTFAAFYRLLDNYFHEEGKTEEVTPEEIEEVRQFLVQTMQTAPLQYVFRYLAATGNLPGEVTDDGEFLEYLYSLWFGSLSRDAEADSSGFEHVFCGETDDGKVGGMHNWIQLLIEERKGNLSYRGYIPTRGMDDAPGTEYVQTLSFDWQGARKKVGSSFFGTSPEYELALYTLCYMMRSERTPMVVDDRYSIEVVCYDYKGKIGTSYPSVVGMDDDE